mmetsp:Transcript_48908/g.140064  ORF Transcript_48908/g.140064 Transcript_48908/m.140064 type:complete len:400 (+) Transcript_48908:439-1638(+)
MRQPNSIPTSATTGSFASGHARRIPHLFDRKLPPAYAQSLSHLLALLHHLPCLAVGILPVLLVLLEQLLCVVDLLLDVNSLPIAGMCKLVLQLQDFLLQSLDEARFVHLYCWLRVDLDALDRRCELQRAQALVEIEDRGTQGAYHCRLGIAVQRVGQEHRELGVPEHAHVRLLLAWLSKALNASRQEHEAAIDECQLDHAIALDLCRLLVLAAGQVHEEGLRGDVCVLAAAVLLHAELEDRVPARALLVHGGGGHGLHRVAVLDQLDARLKGVHGVLARALHVDADLRVHVDLGVDLLAGAGVEEVIELVVVDLEHLDLQERVAALLPQALRLDKHVVQQPQQQALLSHDLRVPHDGRRLPGARLPVAEQAGVKALEDVANHPLAHHLVALLLAGEGRA